MVESGREIFKKAGLYKMTNTKIIKYGKITDNIGYEIVMCTNNSYVDENNMEHLHILSFVEKVGDKYIYNVDNCKNGSLEELLKYITQCKKEKKIIKEV